MNKHEFEIYVNILGDNYDRTRTSTSYYFKRRY